MVLGLDTNMWLTPPDVIPNLVKGLRGLRHTSRDYTPKKILFLAQCIL